MVVAPHRLLWLLYCSPLLADSSLLSRTRAYFTQERPETPTPARPPIARQPPKNTATNEPPWSGCGAVKRWAAAHRPDWRAAFGGKMSHSQFGQDLVVVALVHALSRGANATLGGPFHYVDLAANDPKSGSNTYLLDACFSWKGLCVEPNPQYHAAIRGARSCPLVDTCVSDREVAVDFLAAGPVGHIAGRRLVPMTCTTLRRVLEKHRRVTYLSLDVEGHELPALKGMDWNRTAVDFITLENAKADHVAYLGSRGLRPVVCVGIDTLFARDPLAPAASAWFDANEASLAPLCVDRDVARCQDGDARGYSCAVQTPAVWNAWQGKFPGRRGTG